MDAATCRVELADTPFGVRTDTGVGIDQAIGVDRGDRAPPRQIDFGIAGVLAHAEHGMEIVASTIGRIPNPVKTAFEHDDPCQYADQGAGQRISAHQQGARRGSDRPSRPVFGHARHDTRQSAAARYNGFLPEPRVATTLSQSDLPGLDLIHRGKVRDVYDLHDGRLLMVASDRLSAFDVVLPDPIPGKGEMLTQISNFWFARTAHLLPNHLTGDDVAGVLPAGVDPALYAKRSVVTKKLKPVPVECIARGYLIGSGWKDYQATGRVSGIELPAGLQQAQQLPQAIFTPSTKAAVGDHDENIDFATAVATVGESLATQVRDATLKLYAFARDYAAERGILLADTKFEFGTDADGTLYVMDEMLTPDSSRYWPADSYQVGTSPPSYDKQFVRDYLETLDWNKRAPGPNVPADVIAKTRAKYAEALQRLAGINA